MKFVGLFSENEIKNGLDKIEVEKKKIETGYKYTKTELVKQGKKIVGIKIWVVEGGCKMSLEAIMQVEKSKIEVMKSNNEKLN